MHHITLLPQGWQFDAAMAPDAPTLLQAARAAGLRLPSSCRNGSCRACRCLILSGRASHTIEWPGLSAEELAEGWLLPCVARADGDLVLQVPGASRIEG
ncbi:MAG: Ferredoxin [Pseudomonadota bacterium]